MKECTPSLEVHSLLFTVAITEILLTMCTEIAF